MGLTRQLAERIAAITYEELPAEAIETVKRGSIDCVGVLFAGRDEPVVQILLKQLAAGNEASVLFGDKRASSADAALLNTTAAHALDYDDTGLDGHPSVVLTPRVLA
jgi:2-methylcitrate dehydratase PrpD